MDSFGAGTISVSILERCLSYRESNKEGKEWRGPTLGVRLIEVDVRVSRLYFHLPLQTSLLLFLGLETLFNNNNSAIEQLARRAWTCPLPLVVTLRSFSGWPCLYTKKRLDGIVVHHRVTRIKYCVVLEEYNHPLPPSEKLVLSGYPGI